jgi:hypothetical protein
MGGPMIEKKRIYGSEQGAALISTLLFLMAMGVLSTALVFTVQNEMKSSAAYKYNQQAFFVANGGVQRAVDWYAHSYTPNIAASYDTNTVPVKYSGDSVMLAGREGYSSVYPSGEIVSEFTSEFRDQPLSAGSGNSGVCSLNATMLKHQPTTFLNPTTFQPLPSAVERWRLNSVGYWGTIARPLGIAQITAEIENSGHSLFDRALWGIHSVDLIGGAYIDSYNPALGLWNAATNSGALGAIGSNGSVVGDGGMEIHGSAAFGPSGTLSLGDNAMVTGDIIQLPEPRTFPPIPSFSVGATDRTAQPNANVGDVVLAPGSYKKITARGPMTLQPGTYYIDELTVTSQGQLLLSGDVTLFVKSGFDLEGLGIVNIGANPPNLTVYYSGSAAAKLSGSAQASINYYGPNAQLSLTGTTDFNGSFIGYDVKGAGGSNIHFDEGNLTKYLIPRPFRMITWSQDSF